MPALFCAVCADCAVYQVITVPTYSLRKNDVLCVSECVPFVPFVLLASKFVLFVLFVVLFVLFRNMSFDGFQIVMLPPFCPDYLSLSEEGAHNLQERKIEKSSF